MATTDMNYEERSVDTSKAYGQCANQLIMGQNEDFYSPVGTGQFDLEPQNDSNEMVDHPKHYQAGGLECIDVMEKLFGREAVESWIKLTIFKYSWRSDKKDGAQDIDKIRWYSEKLVSMLKEDGQYL